MTKIRCTIFSSMVLAIISTGLYAGELHDAARKGDTDKVASLIAAGTNPNETDGENATALYIAAGWGRTEVVQLLLELGADPLVRAKTPYGSKGAAIHVASQRGHIDVVEALLDHGVDPNLNDPRMGPPLHLARFAENDEVETLLLERGAKPISAPSIDHLIAKADLKLGERIAVGCASCHDITPTASDTPKEGPSIWGIVGKKKASVKGFEYSKALIELGGSWTYSELNSFVADAMAFVPGTKMYAVAPVATPERRAALLLYLRTLSDSPEPLP